MTAPAAVDVLTMPDVLVHRDGLALRPKRSGRGPGEAERLLGRAELEAVLLEAMLPASGRAEAYRLLAAGRRPKRRVLAEFARREVIPVVAAADGCDRPPPPELRFPAADLSLRWLLEEAGCPSGYMVGPRDRVRWVVPADGSDVPPGSWLRRPRGPSLRVGGSRVRAVAAPVDRDALGARLGALLDAFRAGHERQVRAALRTQVAPPPRAAHSRLYDGPGFSVWLDGDRLSIRRRLQPWTLRSGRTKVHFGPVDVEVRAFVAAGGEPRFRMQGRVEPNIVHPFVDAHGVCVAGYVPREGPPAGGALRLLQRCEEVLKIPVNEGGQGGFRRLEDCA